MLIDIDVLLGHMQRPYVSFHRASYTVYHDFHVHETFYITAPIPHLPTIQITLYCRAENFDRKKLDDLLKMTYTEGTVMSYPVRTEGAVVCVVAG